MKAISVSSHSIPNIVVHLDFAEDLMILFLRSQKAIWS